MFALNANADKTLPNWQQIGDLSHTSGTAVYRTTIDVGPAWTGGACAYLDLGSVLGPAQVVVNRHQLPAATLSRRTAAATRTCRGRARLGR